MLSTSRRAIQAVLLSTAASLPAQSALALWPEAAEPPAPKRSDPFLTKPQDWVVVGLLVGVLLAGAVALSILDRWRRRAMAGRDAGGELTSFRAMYERGEITEEEYNRLRLKVAERVKTPPAPPSVAGAAPGAAPGTATGPTTSPPPAAPPENPGPPAADRPPAPPA